MNEMNQNIMGIFIVVAAVALIIGLAISHARNRAMDEANKRYREAVDEASRAARAANEKLHSLKDALKEENNPAGHMDTIYDMCREYRNLQREAHLKRRWARDCGDEAYNTYVNGVHIQNLFLGGANDLSVLSLRKRYNEYRQVGTPSQLEDATDILVTIEHYRTLLQTGRIRTETVSGRNRITDGQEKQDTASRGTGPALPPPADPGITLPDPQEILSRFDRKPVKKAAPVRRAFVTLLVISSLIVGGVYAYQRCILKNETPFRFYPAVQDTVRDQQ